MVKKISRPDAATGSTTAKQERYEKKMAKYAANKARREQKENEKMMNRKQNESPTFELKETVDFHSLKEVEKVLVKKARYFYDNQQTFIHFPITYKGELNLLTAVSWGRDANNHEVRTITVNSSNERNELDKLWDRVMDKALDIYCLNLLRSGKKHKPRYIKADTVQEAFEIACKENNVKIVFNVA